MGDMSYREMARVLDATKEEIETLRGKFKASQVKRGELTKKLLEISDNSSSDEANIDALAEEVETMNGEKLNLRREIEALTISMRQELEARRAIEDLIKERDHKISKIKQENVNLHEHWHEEKEEK